VGLSLLIAACKPAAPQAQPLPEPCQRYQAYLQRCEQLIVGADATRKQMFNQYREQGYVNLFGAYDGYGEGQQSRDFVSVEDVVKVNLFFFDHPEISGIYNLGTGRSQPFNDLAAATVNACRAAEGKEKMSLQQLVDAELIRYIPFPDALKGKYQSFTEADITQLREAGYEEPFYDVEQGVSRYVKWMLERF
jgi:ADP-L-glycero-D-manno-heptose 6-epimerase